MLLALLAILIVLLVVLPVIGLTLWALISVGFVGLIIGGLARLVLPGRQKISLLATVLLGWIGSLVGGFIGEHLHHGRFLTVLLEIAVAAALIALYGSGSGRSIAGRRRRSLRW